MKLQVGVKVLIKNNSGAFLFLQRSNLMSTDSTETSWDIPGGRISPGEQLHDALRREIMEEIGSDIQSSPKLIAAQDIIVPAKDIHVVRLTYTLEADIPNIKLSHEHIDHRWVMADQFESINVEPYLRRILQDI